MPRENARFQFAPKTSLEWQEALPVELVGVPLKALSNLEPGSSCTDNQFLLYRVLCQATRRRCEFNAGEYGLTPYLPMSFSGIPEGDLHAYLEGIRNHATQVQGEFRSVFNQQLGVTKGEPANLPRRDRKLYAVDETSVNSSLVSLLQAGASRTHTRGAQWRSTRVSLTARLGRFRRPARTFSAVTDGQLQTYGNHHIRALIECKKGRRESHSPQVEKQEVSQFVAWVTEFPDPPAMVQGLDRRW